MINVGLWSLPEARIVGLHQVPGSWDERVPLIFAMKLAAQDDPPPFGIVAVVMFDSENMGVSPLLDDELPATVLDAIHQAVLRHMQ